MALSSALTRMRRAEKGDRTKCSGPFSRRFFDQAPRNRRHRVATRSAIIGDTGYDSNNLRREIRARDKPVIHSKPERNRGLPLDRKLYRKRYLVEVFFHNLKRFRAIATRYEKTARNYLALVHVACAWLWLPPPA